MKWFSGSRTLAALSLAVASAAAADQNAPPGPHGREGFGLRHVEKCLSTVGLSADQKAAIDQTLATGRAALRIDGEAMKAAHRQMEADLAAGADKATLGQNALDQDAARTRLKADTQTIHDQIASQLSPEQVNRLDACTAAPKAWHAHPGPTPTQ